MTSDETQMQIFAHWPMSHAKCVTRDNRKNPEYHNYREILSTCSVQLIHSKSCRAMKNDGETASYREIFSEFGKTPIHPLLINIVPPFVNEINPIFHLQLNRRYLLYMVKAVDSLRRNWLNNRIQGYFLKKYRSSNLVARQTVLRSIALVARRHVSQRDW